VAQARAAELRRLGEAKAAAYAARRAGGGADVVVVRGGANPEGITGDYLSVLCAEPMARRTRFTARLEARPDGRLVASPA
jgi:hypothetical protein